MPGDLVRAAALVSLLVAPFVLGGLGAALFLLVLGGVMVPRAIGVPAALDVPYGLSLLLAAWAAQLSWYEAVPWLDLPVHAACTGLIAAVAFHVLARAGLDPAPATGRTRRRTAAVVATTGLGAVVAILWEVGEWAGYTYLDDGIGVGYTDTIGDLVWALAGAVVAGALVPLRDPVPGDDRARLDHRAPDAG
ncbi:hypothetical protein [Cellulosimicrobium sp. CUA-896]|uniref:hypothetical protein n=1 Tax=Cellulosimicrobium sp. CUA-896 TaxID=1517881 RepID=UPI0021019BBA|nr:hypothetical protein [Cellulosimicrobium sp. CUA-896]